MTDAQTKAGSGARMLLVSVLVVTISTQPLFLLASGAPQALPELGLSTAGLGFLTALYFVAAAIASIPAGRLVERIGWRAGMQWCTGGAVGVLAAVATVGRSVLVVALLLMVGAAFYGFANPAANLALSQTGNPDRHATFFGIKHAGIPASTLLAGLAVPLINVRWGWRWSYSLAIVLALLFLAAMPKPDRVTTSAAPEDEPANAMPRQQLVRLAVVAGLATMAPGALATFTVAAGIDAGLSESAAGWALSMGGFGSIAARVGYGLVTDRRRLSGPAMLATVIGLGSATMAALAVATGPWFTVAVIAAFAVGWGWPGLLTYTVVTGNRARPAAASAVTQAGIFIGAGVGPLWFGWVAETRSFTMAWLLVGASLALAAFTIVPLARTGRE